MGVLLVFLMNTNAWGPCAWRWLHSLTFTPSTKSEEKYRTLLFQLLQFIFPCKYCRMSYSRFIKDNPTKTGENRQKWLFDIHNLVNNKLDKPLGTFKDIRKRYQENLSVSGDSYFAEDLWYFLFCVVENYPTISPTLEKQALYSYFFQVFPKIFSKTDFGKRIQKAFRETPITAESLQGRETLYDWLFELYQKVATSSEIRVVPLPTIKRTMKSIKAK